MFPRPVTLQNPRDISNLLTRLSDLKLINITDNADGSQSIKMPGADEKMVYVTDPASISILAELGKHFLVANNGEIYLLEDIQAFLATASNEEIAAVSIQFINTENDQSAKLPEAMSQPHGDVIALQIDPTIHASCVSLSELKQSQMPYAKLKSLPAFFSLLAVLNPRFYTPRLHTLNSIADLQSTMAAYNNTLFDTGVSELLQQLNKVQAFLPQSLVAVEDVNDSDLEDETLFAIASARDLFDSFVPHKIAKDIWQIILIEKLKLKSQLSTRLAQTNDDAFKAALQNEINVLDESIKNIKALLNHYLQQQKATYSLIKNVEKKYQALIADPKHKASIEKIIEQQKSQKNATEQAKSSNKTSEVLGKIATAGLYILNFLTALCSIGFAGYCIGTLALAVTAASMPLATMILFAIGLAACGVAFSALGIAALFKADTIVTSITNAFTRLRNYVGNKLESLKVEKSDLLTAAAYALSRPADMAAEIAANEQKLASSEAALKRIEAIEAKLAVTIDPTNDAKQQARLTTPPISKFAGVLFSMTKTRSPDETPSVSSRVKMHSSF